MSNKLTSMEGGFRDHGDGEPASMLEALKICYIASRIKHAAFDATKAGLPDTDGDEELWVDILDGFNVLHKMYENRRVSVH